MTEFEFIENCISCPKDSTRIDVIEERFGMPIPDDIKNYFSFVPHEYFCGNWRILSLDEILKANEWMMQNYVLNKIIPFVDLGDMDYISYLLLENKWAIVHDVDGIVFARRDSLIEYIREK